jgi:phosphoribosylamine--glycine ligase
LRLLCIEDSGDGLLDLAIRAAQLGHDCRYHNAHYDPVKAPVGRGLVEREPHWQNSARWADLIVAGGNGKWLRELDSWRATGKLIIGGGAEIAKLELDRMAGMAAFKRARIPIPEFRQCATLREAIEYVVHEDRGFAVKPCGDIADKSTSVVGKTAREVIWRLERWKKEGKSFPGGLMVQERVEGIEMAIGAWVGPAGFVDGWEENFEEKRMFAGGIGPNTGETGTVMRLVRASKLAKMVLAPFEDTLVHSGYCGNCDVNCIIDEDGQPWPLEWTVRLGWPAFNIELALHKADPVEFLAAVASGEKPPARSMNEVAVGVVLALPPYPFPGGRAEEVVDVPVWGVVPSIEDNLHFCNMMAGKDADLSTAGSYVLVGVGTGGTITDARREALRVLNRLTIPASPWWRIDIGTRLRSQLDQLAQHGFALGMTYA